jgi:YD repeat-containing protein
VEYHVGPGLAQAGHQVSHVVVGPQGGGGALQTTATDFTGTLGGVAVALVRGYDSLEREQGGRFGRGWRLVGRDVGLQVGLDPTGREEFGVYAPLALGTRLYLTLPTGQRAGFTFRPVKVTVLGLPAQLEYFRPAWEADSGVAYQLQSFDTLLVRGGNLFYDQATGQPYNPANPLFAGADYTLVAPDGSRDLIDATRGVTEHRTPTGQRLFFRDSGITAESGAALRFVHDAQGRVEAVKLPDGSVLRYRYNDAGELAEVSQDTAGVLTRYGYDSAKPGLLSVTATPTGGTAFRADGDPQQAGLVANLGDAHQFGGHPVSQSMARGGVHDYAFTVSDAQVHSSGGTVLLRVVVARHASLFVGADPEIPGLEPYSRYIDGDRTVVLFGLTRAGTYRLTVRGATPLDRGAYQLSLDVAGDVNHDGLVDGVDSQLVADAFGSLQDEDDYNFAADLDASGLIDSADRLILASNHGFADDFGASTPPEFFTAATVHTWTPPAGAPAEAAGPAARTCRPRPPRRGSRRTRVPTPPSPTPRRPPGRSSRSTGSPSGSPTAPSPWPTRPSPASAGPRAAASRSRTAPRSCARTGSSAPR